MRKHIAPSLIATVGLLVPVSASAFRQTAPATVVATRSAAATPDAVDTVDGVGRVGDVDPSAADAPERQAVVTFSETFDGAPAAPTPWNPANWDVTVHSRSLENFDELDPMAAGHGADCAGPPATHTITSYDDAVFICRDHMMTAIDSGDLGYAAVYLTPNAMVDFSQGEAIVRFDMSTLRTSIRDWPDLWITPYEDNLQLPLEDFYPDLAGPPRRAIHFVAEDSGGETTFRGERYDDFNDTDLPGLTGDTYESALARAGLTTSLSRRDVFELRIGNGRIKFGMPQYGLVFVDAPLSSLGWTSGVVTLGHHSYTPNKDCSNCGPNTWHWDNVVISPARPFTIVRSTTRDARPGRSSITFAQPAPAGAHLRFAGIGTGLDVSFDGGGTWQPATRRAESVSPATDHFSNYWMPIPQGVQTVTFRGGNSFYGQGPWVVRDATLWADNGGSAAPPLPATSTYAPLNPSRLLDTRSTSITSPGQTTEVVVAGLKGVAPDARAVTLNVTSTGATGNGYLTVWPCGQPRPLASNLNFQAGRDVANAVMSNVGSRGAVCIYTGAGSTHLVVDVTGYYPSTSTYAALNPARLLDTRPGTSTADGTGAGGGVAGIGQVLELQVTGRAAVPANAAAVVLNVTATEAPTSGFLTVWPCGQPRPLASSLNFSNGRDVANAVVSAVGTGGRVCIVAGASPTHVVVDVSGYFPAGAGYRALTPARLLDSRPGATTADGLQQGIGRPAAASVTRVTVGGRAGVPAGATAVALNVTATGAAAAGYLTVWPCGYAQPLASSLNYSAGRDVANLVVSSLGSDQTVCVYSGVAATDLVVDVVGYFPADGTAAGTSAFTPGLSRVPGGYEPSYCDLRPTH